MYRLYAIFLTVSFILLVACGGNSGSDDPWSNALETYENDPSPQSAKIILGQVDPDPWKESTEVNLEERMDKAYEVAAAQDLKEHARKYLIALILKTHSSAKRSEYLKKLTELYDKNEGEGQISFYINQGMGNASGSLDSSINRLGRNLYDSARHRMDERKARQFLDACEAYTLTHPDDPSSAQYLHSAAETARSLEQYERSLFYYDWVYNEFPKSEKRPLALFLTGFTYDDDLGQLDSAEMFYREFIEKYPDHELTDDAQFLLDNLGKSEDEIMKNLERGKQE